MIDESKRFVPLGFVGKGFLQDVSQLLISANIDHVKKSALELLLQPSKRNALSAIGMSHFLTISHRDNRDRGLVVFKELDLKLLRKVNIQPIDIGNGLSVMLGVTYRIGSHQVQGQPLRPLFHLCELACSSAWPCGRWTQQPPSTGIATARGLEVLELESRDWLKRLRSQCWTS